MADNTDRGGWDLVGGIELIASLEAKVRYLLDTHGLWSPEGAYTFPDGETWYDWEPGDAA